MSLVCHPTWDLDQPKIPPWALETKQIQYREAKQDVLYSTVLPTITPHLPLSTWSYC